MKSRDVVPKNVPGVWWFGVGHAGVGHEIGCGGVGHEIQIMIGWGGGGWVR